MVHIVLVVYTIAVIRYAWINFKKLGTVRVEHGAELSVEQRDEQMRYITRIVVCMILLAIAPFIFAITSK